MTRIFVACIALAMPVFSAVIDFDSLLDGAIVTNQYAGVLFSSNPGFENIVTTQANYNGTVPNFLCTSPGAGEISCSQETILDFASGVNGLMFQGMGINDASANVAQVDVFVAGAFDSTITIAGNKEGLNPRLVDLSAFSGVTRIRIYNISDGGGIGWDTFTYATGAAPVVAPEPSTVVLLGAGLLMVFCAKRRSSHS
jgi:hypothetical protein